MPPWYWQHLKHWVIFSHVKKIAKKRRKKLHSASPTLWATHKNSEKNPNFMGTWIWRKNKISCTWGYMDLKKKQNIMYQVTWIWKKKFLCVAQLVGEAWCQIPLMSDLYLLMSNFWWQGHGSQWEKVRWDQVLMRLQANFWASGVLNKDNIDGPDGTWYNQTSTQGCWLRSLFELVQL